METNQDWSQKRERLSELEKGVSRGFNIFGASVLTTLVCSVLMVNSLPEDQKNYAIQCISCVPLTFIAWVNAMSYKTEEYCRLTKYFDCGER